MLLFFGGLALLVAGYFTYGRLVVNRVGDRRAGPVLVWNGGMRKLDDLLPNEDLANPKGKEK